MKKRIISKILIFTLAVCMFVSPILGFIPYDGYVYNSWGEEKSSPVGYIPTKTINGNDIGCGVFSEPNDLYHDDANKKIYILDSKNSRVVITDENFKYISQINKFTYNGTDIELNKPEGLTVDEKGNLYICDTQNLQLLKCDITGKVLLKITLKSSETEGGENITQSQAENFSEVLDKDYVFKPSKVVIGFNDEIYVVAAGTTQGIIKFKPNGKFAGFFGAPKIELSLQMAAQQFWRKLMSEEQLNSTTRYVPIEFSNLFLMDDGFIYAIVGGNETSTGEVYKLNFLGKNVMTSSRAIEVKSKENNYGDYNLPMLDEEPDDNVFSDVYINEANGLITILDSRYNKAFEYDADGNLLFVYGAQGNQTGTFVKPKTIDKINDKMYIMDSEKGNITEFVLSDFADTVHYAVEIYSQGDYAKAMDPWNQVLKENVNYDFAHVGIGKVYLTLKQPYEAMKHFKIAGDRTNYSKAFKEYRTKLSRDMFGWIMGAVVLLGVIVFLYTKKKQQMINLFHKIIKRGKK